MSEQIIAASIQVDTGTSNANVAGLNQETSKLKTSLKDTGASVKTASKDVSDAGGSFSNLKEKMGAIPGPAKGATEAVGGFNNILNVLKANPIIAVIALVVAIIVVLWEKFKKMEAVSDALNKAFGVLSGVMSIIVDKVLTPLIDGFVKLVDIVTKAGTFIVGLFSKSLAEAATRSGELAEALDDLEKAESKSALARAESNRKLQEARELAGDANVPIKERIVALREAGKIEKEELDKSILIATTRAKIMLEQIGMELGVRKELIESIKNGSIEQLKAARNEIMAMKNVDREKVAAIDALIIQAEDQGAQRAKIGKKTERQITSLEKEEETTRKEARKKAEEEEKARKQKLNEFNTKLRQLQSENEVSQIKDSYQKELKALDEKIKQEKAANEQAVKDNKYTRQQADQLNAELDKQSQIKRQEITDKHNKEVEAKELTFQTALNKLKQEIMLGGIVDSRQLEKEQLRIAHEQSIAEAEKQYKDDAEKLAQIKALIDDKYRQDQKNLQKKQDEEDDKDKKEKAKKAYEDSIKKDDKIINKEIDPTLDFKTQLDAKKAALDAEQVLVQKAFDDKVISEQEYNDRLEQFKEVRKKIGKEEFEFKKQQVTETGDMLGKLSDIVGKQTIAGKALGIATALINTYQGASEALKQPSTLPSPFDFIAKAVNVGSVIATGLKTVKAITAVQVPGGGGGGSQGSAAPISAAVPAPVAPTVLSTKINQAAVNAAGNTAEAGVNKAPLRAYVINGDIQSASERDARLERASKLGG
jgi:hypothetical protein